jgi:hypothetical protein
MLWLAIRLYSETTKSILVHYYSYQDNIHYYYTIVYAHYKTLTNILLLDYDLLIVMIIKTIVMTIMTYCIVHGH